MTVPEPEWVSPAVVHAVHDRQIAEHGGARGLRDAGLLEGALFRPRNLWAYGEPDLADLAAAYAFGIASAHAFVDGNKRTAWVVARTFLRLAGRGVRAEQAEIVRTMEALGAGELDEAGLAAWLRDRFVGVEP